MSRINHYSLLRYNLVVMEGVCLIADIKTALELQIGERLREVRGERKCVCKW